MMMSSSAIRPALLRGVSTAALRQAQTLAAPTLGAYAASMDVTSSWSTTVHSSTCCCSSCRSVSNNNKHFTTTTRSFCAGTDDDKKKKKEPAIDLLFEKNRAWVDSVNAKDPDFFPELGKGQSPDYLYIGCSDSRVAISDLTGLGIGNFFVHRNIANMVVSSDLNLLSVLTYAVEHLKVKHILVTGHYDCGGVKASVQKKDYGQVLDAWLQNIRDVYRLHKSELDAIESDECKHRRLVELNVVEQCLNLYKTSVVQKRRLETHADPDSLTYPRIHGLVFDPATGVLNKIPIDFRHKIADLGAAYDLFDVDEYEKALKKEYLLNKPKPDTA